jgi:hypothetical protein
VVPAQSRPPFASMARVAKIARDFFQLLYLFDPVDCRGLTD